MILGAYCRTIRCREALLGCELANADVVGENAELPRTFLRFREEMINVELFGNVCPDRDLRKRSGVGLGPSAQGSVLGRCSRHPQTNSRAHQ